MTYPERIATDLSRAVGVQPGSVAFHAIVGAISEVIEDCARYAAMATYHQEDPDQRPARFVRGLLADARPTTNGRAP